MDEEAFYIGPGKTRISFLDVLDIQLLVRIAYPPFVITYRRENGVRKVIFIPSLELTGGRLAGGLDRVLRDRVRRRKISLM